MHPNASNERVHHKVVWGVRVRLAVAVLAAALLTSCSDTVRSGQGSSYLVMTTLSGKDGVPVASDVISDKGTIFSDTGTASFRLEMKDVLNQPSPNNAITLTQFHVEYIRSDGHNVQGVDVPFSFTYGTPFGIKGRSP